MSHLQGTQNFIAFSKYAMNYGIVINLGFGFLRLIYDYLHSILANNIFGYGYSC